MMTLRDLINKLLGRETASANTARERLQLVLAHDRVDMSSLSTDLLDKMRKEILDVVAKDVEIDFVTADLTKDDGWDAAFKGCDGIFHVASPFPFKPPKNPETIFITESIIFPLI